MSAILGAAIAVSTGIGAAIGIGLATSKASEAIAKQPQAQGDVTKALLLGCALAEATAIYGFVIGLLIIVMGGSAATSIAAAISVLIDIAAGIGIGLATANSVKAIGRQPESAGDITKTLLLGCALAEATAIYGFVVALLSIIMA
jgi:F-type H+-transporting ATPase subunit c